ncbi:toll-like receptor 4 [Mya arenaria]|uniref:toll-like receptor 4 n=1 Tax=Mya arenaria TaxID=6604 RepID=UPI0022E8D11E|nr:toll-like receptor 4 [Mya arenaria]
MVDRLRVVVFVSIVWINIGVISGQSVEQTTPRGELSLDVTQDGSVKTNSVESVTLLKENTTFDRLEDDNAETVTRGDRQNSVTSRVVNKADLVFDTTKENVTIRIPEAWHGLCTVRTDQYVQSEFTPRTPLTTLICDVKHVFSGVWRMTDLRELLLGYNQSGIAFGLEIQCDPYSKISLSWPVKIPNLYKLVVRGCVIYDYLAEHSNRFVEITPDALRHIDMSNNIVAISVNNFINMTKNIRFISKKFDCVHENTIEFLRNRNTSYTFLEDNRIVIQKISELGEQFIQDVQRVAHVCDYRHLMELDEGVSDSRSIYHMKLATEKSVYFELRTYNLSHNYLKVLQDPQLQWSSNFPKLELFDLSHNNISRLYRFEIPLHQDMSRITTINLQYNNITTLTVSDLERFKEMPMMFIDIRNNPIDCNCSEFLKEILTYIKDGNHKRISNITDYTYIGQLKCASPPNLKGRTLASLSGEAVCEPNVEYFLVPLIVLSVVVIVVVVTLVVALRYRQEITVILFTRFNIIIPCQSRESFDSSKKYDAFVSYSSNEEEEVEKLFDEMEKPSDDSHGIAFKFCLHHRDFVPGRTIFENVSKSVESSRHTIILLSKHFLKSQFCLYEFQEAFRQSIMEQKRHLVIVMMEDLPEDSLPRDLKRCIKTFTYIRRDDYLFKQRLVYALAVKHKAKVVIDQSKSKTLNKTYTNKAFDSNASRSDTQIKTDSSIDILQDISNFRPLTRVTSDTNKASDNLQNELNKSDTANNNDNENAMVTVVKRNSHNLDINIEETQLEGCHSPIERKISNLDFDRCVSSDTGYGSDRGSYCEKLSPEVITEGASFPQKQP